MDISYWLCNKDHICYPTLLKFGMSVSKVAIGQFNLGFFANAESITVIIKND